MRTCHDRQAFGRPQTRYYEYFVDCNRTLSDFVYPIQQGNTGPANDYLAANCSPVTQPGG